MMGKRLWIGLIVTVMVAILIYVSYGMVNVGKKETYHSVAVVLGDSSHDRWNAFKEGLEQGAEENHIHLNVVFTGVLQSQEEECTAIRRELENGAEGLIVQVIAEESPELFEKTVGETPTVLIENDMGSEDEYTTVAADQGEIGAAVAQSVLSGESGDMQGLRIGVLAGNQSMHSQRKCLESFLDAMEGSGAEIAWIRSEEEWDRDAAAGLLREDAEVDVVVALDNNATECAVTFLQENSDISWRIYGEGRSEKAIYYLDKGSVKALVVPGGFYMGYRSAELMARKLKLKTSDEKDGEAETHVDFLTVTRENLYDKNVEKILYPIVS